MADKEIELSPTTPPLGSIPQVPTTPSDEEFFLWFINPGSGGQSGTGILKHLNEHIYKQNPMSGAAYSLTGDPDRDHPPFKPHTHTNKRNKKGEIVGEQRWSDEEEAQNKETFGGLYFVWDLLDLYQDIPRPLRVVVAGGDGTIVWVLNALSRHPGMRARLDDTTRHERIHMGPVVGAVPLGTGNDMSRYLKWGEGISSASQVNYDEFFEDMRHADSYSMDRWKIQMDPPPKGTTTFGANDTSYFCNYFSIGVDGKVAKDFESCRGSCGSCFCCPCINKLWYAWHGGKCTTACTCTRVDKVAKINSVDDQGEVQAVQHIEHDSVAWLNIASFSAGLDLWSMKGGYIDNDAHAANDGKLEVVGIDSTTQLGVAQACTCCSHFDRLSQGNKYQIRVHHPVHMQMDGEAWYVDEEQLAGGHVDITITRDYSMPMLMKADAITLGNPTQK